MKNIVAENGREVEIFSVAAVIGAAASLSERTASIGRIAALTETGAKSGRFAVSVYFVVIIFFAFFLIAQNIVSTGNFLELLRSVFVVFVKIGVIFAGKLAVCRFDFGIARVFGNPQNMIQIFIHFIKRFLNSYPKFLYRKRIGLLQVDAVKSRPTQMIAIGYVFAQKAFFSPCSAQ